MLYIYIHVWMNIEPSSVHGLWGGSRLVRLGLAVVPGAGGGCRPSRAPGNTNCCCSEVVCNELEAVDQKG